MMVSGIKDKITTLIKGSHDIDNIMDDIINLTVEYAKMHDKTIEESLVDLDLEVLISYFDMTIKDFMRKYKLERILDIG